MRRTKASGYTTEAGRVEVVVRELTGIEIDRLYDQAEQMPMTMFDNLLDLHDITGSMLATICGLQAAQLAEALMPLPPSCWRQLLDDAKEVNPDFFAVARQIKNRAAMLAEYAKIVGSSLGEGFPGLSSVDTSTPGNTGSP